MQQAAIQEFSVPWRWPISALGEKAERSPRQSPNSRQTKQRMPAEGSSVLLLPYWSLGERCQNSGRPWLRHRQKTWTTDRLRFKKYVSGQTFFFPRKSSPLRRRQEQRFARLLPVPASLLAEVCCWLAMVKYEECKFSRARSLTISQCIAIFLAVVALGFGITCIVYTGKAHLCFGRPGPSTCVLAGIFWHPPCMQSWLFSDRFHTISFHLCVTFSFLHPQKE